MCSCSSRPGPISSSQPSERTRTRARQAIFRETSLSGLGPALVVSSQAARLVGVRSIALDSVILSIDAIRRRSASLSPAKT